MKPQEARVFIIDDDPKKTDHLAGVVHANGGTVVGNVETLEAAYETIDADDFPNNAGNPNVVLIDGNLDEHGRRGTDGENIFLGGYNVGLLRKANVKDGLGILAMGCSVDSHSAVATATGANYRLRYDGLDSQHWAELLDGHTDTPQVAPPDSIERQTWDGFDLYDMLSHLFKEDEAKLLSLTIIEQLKDGDELVTEEFSPEDPSIIDSQIAVMQGGPTSKSLPSEMLAIRSDALVDQPELLQSHAAKAVVQTDTNLIFISHSWKPNTNRRHSFDPDFWFTGTSDIIPLDKVHELPASYWQEVGFDPEMLKV